MKVKVIPPLGSDISRLDERYWIDLPDGTTVSDVLKIIKCSKLKAKFLLVSVNGERAEFSRVLESGDVLGFFFPVTGG